METTKCAGGGFRGLAGAGLLFVTACVAGAGAQQTNFPPSQTNGPVILSDTDRQAKAREAVQEAEKQLEAGKTNLPAAAAASAPANTQTNAPAPASAPAPQAAAAKKTAPESNPEIETEDLNNWVELGVGGSIVSGDRAQYQRQSGLPNNTAFGGVQSMHYETPIGKKGLFTIDGRGIFDNHDYDIKLEAQHPDEGYVTAGFRQFREYYDASGGFLPSTGQFFALTNNELALDRGTAYLEAGLTLPDMPVVKLRFEHDYRDGQKDSTEWGTTTLTPGAAQIKVTPAYRQIDEKTDFIAADVTHTLWDTDLGLGVRYEWIKNNDSLNVLFSPNQGTAGHTLTQLDGNGDNIFNIHAFTDSRLDKELEFSTGWAYTSMAEQIFGNRLDYPATTTSADTRYANLAGESDFVQYEMDANLAFTPRDDLYIVPSFRVDKEDTAGWSADNTVAGNNVIGALNSFGDNEARLDVAESLDARYTGFTNWVLYLRGDLEQNRDNLELTTAPAAQLTNLWHQNVQKYTAGANWYPLQGLNFAAQYYHKIDDNNYENTTPTPTAYPAFISQENFKTDDANFRVTWRPFSQLTLVSRYDFQYSTIDMAGFGLAEIQAANNITHQVGETVSWTPLTRLSLTLAGNYVMDHTHTPAETQTAPTGIVEESKNDYWTANATVTLALDNKSQLRVGYVFYRAADYVDNSGIGGLPYGAGGEQNTVTASLDRQITRRLKWTIHYNFTKYTDQLFGGNLDYTAHTILSSVQYRF
jgi:hypothetical protein